MTDHNLIPVLRAELERAVQQAPKQHRLRTPQCPPLTRFGVALDEGWTPQEKEHVDGCSYCQKIIAIDNAEKISRAAIVVVLMPQHRMRQYATLRKSKEDPTSMGPEELRQRYKEYATPRKSEEDPTPETIPLTARVNDTLSWSLAAQDGEPTIPLSADLAEHYYGNANVNRVRMWLHVVVTEAGELRPELEALPGPTNAPMTVVITFPTGETRALDLPAESGGSLRKLRSAPGDPLPRSALGISEGPVSAAEQWPASIELRGDRCLNRPDILDQDSGQSNAAAPLFSGQSYVLPSSPRCFLPGDCWAAV